MTLQTKLLRNSNQNFLIPPSNSYFFSGPDQSCGGKDGFYGICGEGLICSNCLRCEGVSFVDFSESKHISINCDANRFYPINIQVSRTNQ